jgi:peptidoglycan/xylan/chitin deacetylase (PgdA/CDA1 family)
MYHRIGEADRQPDDDVYTVALENFAEQLRILDHCGCAAVTMAQAGPSAGPPLVALTFDDGFASDLHAAAPLLAAHGRQATYFLSPALVGRPGYLTWDEARELSRLGHEIGAHGWDHRNLDRLTETELRRDVRESRREIEARVGRECLSLSLPNGAGGKREVAIAREEGFRHVAGSVPRRILKVSPSRPLPRIAVRRADTPRVLRAIVEQRRGALGRALARHMVLQGLRSVLGERLYGRLRGRWTHSGAPAA